jgi:hypothetical protein
MENCSMTDLDDLHTFLAAAGCLYVKWKLSPPFHLREVAEGWKRNGISLSYCFERISSHLDKYSGLYRHGSGDWGLRCLDEEIQKSSHLLQRPARTMMGMTDGLYPTSVVLESDEWLDRLHRAPKETQPIGLKPIEVGSEDEIKDVPTYQGATRASQPPTTDCADGAPNPAQATRQKEIDRAVNFLCRELANGEVEARIVEEHAGAEGISLRTLDRARKRLNVVSRRTSFGGPYWLSLPVMGT